MPKITKINRKIAKLRSKITSNHIILSPKDKDVIKKIENVYLKAVKNDKYNSFRLFSLDASNLQVLDNLESQNTDSIDKQIHGLDTQLMTLINKQKDLNKQLKDIKNMISLANDTNETSTLCDAEKLLNKLLSTKQKIEAKQKTIRKTIRKNMSALYRIEL
jgi:chaperonin cofactor prefoldin